MTRQELSVGDRIIIHELRLTGPWTVERITAHTAVDGNLTYPVVHARHDETNAPASLLPGTRVELVE